MNLDNYPSHGWLQEAETPALDADQAARHNRQPDLEIRQILGEDGARIIARYVEHEVERLLAKHDRVRAREIAGSIDAAGAILDEYSVVKG